MLSGFKTLYVNRIEEYHSYRNLRFEFDKNKFQIRSEGTLKLNALLRNKTGRSVNLDSLLSKRPLYYFIYEDGNTMPAVQIQCNECVGEIADNGQKQIHLDIQAPSTPGKYFIRFGLYFALGMPEQNSDFVILTVVSEN